MNTLILIFPDAYNPRLQDPARLDAAGPRCPLSLHRPQHGRRVLARDGPRLSPVLRSLRVGPGRRDSLPRHRLRRLLTDHPFRVARRYSNDCTNKPPFSIPAASPSAYPLLPALQGNTMCIPRVRCGKPEKCAACKRGRRDAAAARASAAFSTSSQGISPGKHRSPSKHHHSTSDAQAGKP